MVLDREALLQAMELKTERVQIGDGEVIITEIGAADYIALYSDPALQTDGAVDMAKFSPALVARSVIDEQGNRIFTDEDIAAIGKGSVSVFEKLAATARRLNGLSGSIEEAAKN
jgi:hypothetical protein